MEILAYERQGSGIPLVLLHGYPLQRAIWQPLLPYLTASFDVILPDLRGFGQSSTLAAAGTMEEYASDVLRLLDFLQIPHAYLAGHSMGGYIALQVARLAPQRLLGLALLASQAAEDTPERRESRAQTIAQVQTQGVSAVLGMAEKLSANPTAHAPFLREIISAQTTPAIQAALHAMMTRPDASAWLREFTQPLLALHGLEDTLISPERARETQALHPAPRLILLPGVGHMPMLEAPTETAQALLQFLSL
jgi:pimeloyl-ACP methyl ester carboxylesterase